jgi:hypothetical protein
LVALCVFKHTHTHTKVVFVCLFGKKERERETKTTTNGVRWCVLCVFAVFIYVALVTLYQTYISARAHIKLFISPLLTLFLSFLLLYVRCICALPLLLKKNLSYIFFCWYITTFTLPSCSSSLSWLLVVASKYFLIKCFSLVFFLLFSRFFSLSLSRSSLVVLTFHIWAFYFIRCVVIAWAILPLLGKYETSDNFFYGKQ